MLGIRWDGRRGSFPSLGRKTERRARKLENSVAEPKPREYETEATVLGGDVDAIVVGIEARQGSNLADLCKHVLRSEYSRRIR